MAEKQNITRKKIKQVLYSLGFHHSWGYYIHSTSENKSSSNRIIFDRTRKKNKTTKIRSFIIKPTRHGNHFHAIDFLKIEEDCPDVALDCLRDYLKMFFKLS